MSLTGSETKDTIHLIGRVKWFNNKVGYGFITITDGERSGSDIFVHHSAINVENQQYKYLVQGEYVELDLIRPDTNKHEWQASNIIGIKGGKLMCETRRDLKIARTTYRSNVPHNECEESVNYQVQKQAGDQNVSRPRQRNYRPRNSGGRNSMRERRVGDDNRQQNTRIGDKKEWTVVSRNKRKSNDKSVY